MCSKKFCNTTDSVSERHDKFRDKLLSNVSMELSDELLHDDVEVIKVTGGDGEKIVEEKAR